MRHLPVLAAVNRRVLLVLLLSVTLAACAARSNRKMTAIMNTWLGHPIQQATASWGPPSMVYDETPYRVYVWRSTRTFVPTRRQQDDRRSGGIIGAVAEAVTSGRGDEVRTVTTYRMFWVNKHGIIERWQYGPQP